MNRRLTEEESPESRTREIRTSGLMRGGSKPLKPTTAAGLTQPLASAYSTAVNPRVGISPDDQEVSDHGTDENRMPAPH